MLRLGGLAHQFDSLDGCLEAVNETILSTFGSGADACAVFGDPEGQRHGVFWFVEGEVTDGAGQPAGRRVFCLYQAGVCYTVHDPHHTDHSTQGSSEAPG